MGVERRYLPYNVVEASRRRIINVFSNGTKVYLSTSGGKDSIVLMHLVYSLIREGRIDPKQLIVSFIDEEAMFDDVIEIVKDWRKRFLAVGAEFRWYCVEVKHYSCFNMLTMDESFIVWDSTCPDKWIREMPAFAITDHPLLKRRTDRYQEFLEKVEMDGLTITGVRVTESVQRLKNFSQKRSDARTAKLQPIFEWRDTDIWRYIAENGLDFPETYLNLYRIGKSRREMRISTFFSVDVAKSLARLAEIEPDLMDGILAREPNAYLAMLYWDTEMFRSTSGARSKADATGEGDDTDWRQMAIDLLRRGPMDPTSVSQNQTFRELRHLTVTSSTALEPSDWRQIYTIATAGDPKKRAIRAFLTNLASKAAKNSKETSV